MTKYVDRRCNCVGRLLKGDPRKQNLFIKNYVFILTCLNFSHLQSTLHLMYAILLLRCFFYCSKQLLNSLILTPFSTSVIFCFTFSTWAKCFPLRTFFQGNNNKKVAQCEIGRIGRVGYGGLMPFFVKNHRTLSTVWTGGLINDPSWNRQRIWTCLPKKKKIHWSQMELPTTKTAGTLVEMGS